MQSSIQIQVLNLRGLQRRMTPKFSEMPNGQQYRLFSNVECSEAVNVIGKGGTRRQGGRISHDNAAKI
jgi:hypothetical protein